MPYFLGVDAGGTKTEFLLGDESRERARVLVGSIKRMRVDAEEAEANLCQALDELARLSGIHMSSVAGCRIGAAGNRVPLVANWLRDSFARHLGCPLSLVNDVEIALDAAFQGGRGILVLAGTGSNIAGRTMRGEIVTSGGWGPALADQGSGYFLGHLGLRRSFLALDQLRATSILPRVLAHWNLGSLEELVAYANRQPAPDFSRLAPLIVACAEEGDEVAREVIQQGARELADLVCLVIERVRDLENTFPFTLPVLAYTGSVITHATCLRKALYEELCARHRAITLREEPADPAAGALWGARLQMLADAQRP